MKNYMTAVLAFIVLMGAGVPNGYAGEKAAARAPRIEMLDDATMTKMRKLGMADEQNRILASIVGAWDFDLHFWSKEDSDPQFSTGTAANEMIFDNRFLSSKMLVILNIGGETIPYEGWSLEGYDTIRKAYTSVLIDKMHTGITTGAGQYNEKTKTLEQKGSFTHPLIDRESRYRSELEFTSDDTYKRTVYITGKDGREFKALEIDFRRQR